MSAKVMSGYKQTEVGVIPEDWDTGVLEDLAVKVGSGITPRGGEKVYKKEGRPFLRSQNVGWGNLLLDDIAFIDEEMHSLFSTTEINLDDVLLNITGASIGRCAIADYRLKGGNVNQHVCIIRADANKLLPHFLNLFLLSVKGQRQIDSFQAGGNRQGLNFGQIKSFRLALPPLPEQRAIAAALSDVDALLTALDALIAKKRLIKQGAMQELLRPKDEWITIKLGGLGTFLKGSGIKKDESLSGPLACVRYGEIYTRHNDYIRNFYSWISPAVAATARRLKTGDVLFAGSGETKEEIGKCVAFVNDIEAYAGGDVVILRPERANSLFLGYYLNTESIKRQKASRGQGDAVVHISATSLANIELILPPIEDQNSITANLSDMDAEITALEQRREKTRRLKQGMMQELLTGKTRLV